MSLRVGMYVCNMFFGCLQQSRCLWLMYVDGLKCIKERCRQSKGNSHPNNITFDFNDHSFLKNHKFENELKAKRETIVTKGICWA